MATSTDTELRAAPVQQRSPHYQVLLHNDDHNPMDFVAACLVTTFGMEWPDAWAVMSEAHCTGVALCRIEAREAAETHRDRLRSHGLTATVQPDRR